MAQQLRNDITTENTIISGRTVSRPTATIFQDAGRTAGDLLQYTLMAQVAATGKFVPFEDETAVDGTAIVRGIYVGNDIAEAVIIAGDVVDVPIVVGGDMATYDKDKVVVENSKTLATIVDTGAVNAHTVADDLARIGLFDESTVSINGFENA